MADINWAAPAELRQVGVEQVIRGDLRKCVQAYLAMDEADRHGAMVISEELVPMADGQPGLKTITSAELGWLAAQIPK